MSSTRVSVMLLKRVRIKNFRSVRDVTVDVGGLRLGPRDRRGFSVDDVQVHFRGICEECEPSAPG